MLARRSLRLRIAYACATLSVLLSIIFSSATLYLAEDYEELMVAEVLREQAKDYIERLRIDPQLALPRTQRLSGYLRRTDGSGDLPPELAALSPGIHEVDAEGLHAVVSDVAAGRLVFVIDLSTIETLEHYLWLFSAVVIVLGGVLGGWTGWLLAGHAIAPVRQLADAVDALPVRAEPSNLSRLVGSDELGRLARAIDANQQRLVEAAAAESAFFADASHTLRTPIAVVKGAVDVLVDEPVTDTAFRRRLARLERGVDELADLIEAMLGLARRKHYESCEIDAAVFLDEALTPTRAAADTLHIRIDAVDTLWLAHVPALIVVRGLLRRLVPPLTAGTLQATADAGRIEFVFMPAASRVIDRVANLSGLDLAPTLLVRFAEHLGWQVDEAVGGDGAVRVTLWLPVRHTARQAMRRTAR
ncbi:MAG: HAMP domain-containing histidine kinase [Rhodanobacteraceae bacterium]|nr:HAMP domain-containing histidine kinase [Rhodanobacteraceae bacterium]